MRTLLLILCLPLLAIAQPLQFQFQPAAFPASINGVPISQPWIGGLDATTPTFCDLDNDGKLDLFSGNNTGYITYFKNTGSATMPIFQFITDFFDSLVSFYYYGTSPSWDYSNIHFADLDGDGLKDAILTGITSANYLRYYHNHGTSTQPLFYPPADTMRDVNGNLISPGAVALADIDGDGRLDLFVGTYNGYIKYYHNVGTATNPVFQLVNPTWFNIHTTEGYAATSFGDLDGDGDLDLLIGTGQGHVIYYRNDGTPQNPQMTLITNNYLNIAVQKYASPELADIDGDGDLDLFVGRSSSEDQNPAQGDLFFYRNNGTPHHPNFTFVTSNYIGWDCGYCSAPRLVDVDGDGLPDLLSHMGSHLIYYHNTGTPGNPNFVYASSNFGNLNLFDIDPWFVDINGDGLLDIIAGTSAIPGPPGLKLYLNQGTPQVPNWVLTYSDLVPGVFNTTSAHLSCWTGDIDHDGDQDLFVTDDNGYLYFFRNIGTPTNFQFQYVTNNWQNLGSLNQHGFRYGCFFDIDSDGDLDLFINKENYYWFPFDKNLQFYRNIGTPQNANLVLENNDLFPDQMIWQSAAYVIDIDGDGKGDLFVGDTWGGIRYFKNITGESPVNPDPKRPVGPPEREITILPNPSNSGATISYVLSHPQHVNLSVYNILGARLATLVDGWLPAGTHGATFAGEGRGSGIYLVRLESEEGTFTKKMVVVK